MLGRHLSCTKLPCSASFGVWTTLLPLPVARSPKLHSRHRDRRLRVGPRFECLQTKRCAYLWSVRYPCSIFHTLVSRFLAVPPPPFRLLVFLRRCLTRSELPLRTHNFRSFFRGLLRPRFPFWTSSGLWAVLSFDSNRLSILRQFSLCARLLFLLRGVLKIRSPSYL